MRRGWIALALTLAVVLAGARDSQPATIVIVNNDGPGEGFNDPTPVAPVGGNPEMTRGRQRLYVFQTAADMWGSVLPSSVLIQVLAQFNPQSCSATSAVLGSAGPGSLHADFAGAPIAGTQYPQALANKLSGSDLSANYDISATFNSDLDNSTCLGTRDWYYGVDGNEGTHVELLPVVLHELGHGLGFTASTNQNGTFHGSGQPTIASRYMRDMTSGLFWYQMTSGQRQTSAVNTGNLVWDGPNVNAMAPGILEPRRIMTVHAPAPIAGTYLVGVASFGADVAQAVATAPMVLADDGTATPTKGCAPYVNAAAVAGNIAVVDRGGSCTFVAKALNAQAAGAVGLIVADSASSPIPPELGGTDPAVTIPVVGVTQADGNLLKANLAGSSATLGGLHPTIKAGAHSSGLVLLYAPSPFEGGSSISHWDRSAYPNLLMEPSINPSLHRWIDLTRYHFADLGWFTGGTVAVAGRPPGDEPLRSLPNPFASGTRLHFRVERAGRVDLELFDLGGRRVRRLTADDLPSGPHAVLWDGRDETGQSVAAGVYLVRLTQGDRVEHARTVRVE